MKEGKEGKNFCNPKFVMIFPHAPGSTHSPFSTVTMTGILHLYSLNPLTFKQA